MQLGQMPLIGSLLAAGADDRIFDTLLVLGPVIIIIVALIGRNPISVVLAGVYTIGFSGYIGYKGVAELRREKLRRR